MTFAASQDIHIEETPEGERTLFIRGHQAMQAWEADLMCFSADVLTAFGTRFAEAGLGLGISALHLASRKHVKHHTVVEIYPEVIRLFQERHPVCPSTLHIVCGDFFDWVRKVPPASLDGIFFDPALSPTAWDDTDFWREQMPWIVRSIRSGGAFVPFFSTEPVLREQFLPYFAEIRCYPRPFKAYAGTNYTHGTEGVAIVQSFIKS